MCEECPFRDVDEKEKQECAVIPAHVFTCHLEDGPGGGWSGIQCRGHWEAQRKYGGKQFPSPAKSVATSYGASNSESGHAPVSGNSAFRVPHSAFI